MTPDWSFAVVCCGLRHAAACLVGIASMLGKIALVAVFCKASVRASDVFFVLRVSLGHLLANAKETDNGLFVAPP